jgi:heme A synthase
MWATQFSSRTSYAKIWHICCSIYLLNLLFGGVMESLGDVFGSIGLISILYLASRPVLQTVVEQYRQKGETLPDMLKKIYQFVIKTHRHAGFVAVGAIVLHFFLQYREYGVVPVAGLIAGLLLMAQSVLGFGLTKQKNKERRKKMALLHRALGMLIVAAVLVHLVVGSLTDPQPK